VEKLELLPLQSGTGLSIYSLHFFSRVLEFLAREIMQENEMKEIQIGKEEVKGSWS
jgi:hypothetical protein